MGVTGVAVGRGVAVGVTGVAVGRGVLVGVRLGVTVGVRVGIGVGVRVRVGVRVKVGAGPWLDWLVGDGKNGLRVDVAVTEGVGETNPAVVAVSELIWLGWGVNVIVGVKDGVGE